MGAVFVVASVSGLPGRSAAQETAESLLRRVADASRRELALVESGDPLIKTIDAGTPRELAQVYAVRVRAPTDHIIEAIRRDWLLLDDAASGGRGVFGRPPAVADLSGLTLPRSEIRDLERCRRTACDLKLPGEAIDRLRTDVDWDARSAGEDANRLFRLVLLDALARYSSSGDRAAPTYDDKPEPLSVGEGLAILLERFRYLDQLDPSFRTYLADYPAAGTPGVDDVFTWTVEDLGVKPLVSLNHIAFKPAGAAAGASLIAVKRFYSSHYFQADLRIICLLPAGGDPDAPDTYVVVFSRQRFDGELGGLRRTAAERRLERNAETTLAAIKDGLEASFEQERRRRDAGSEPDVP